MHGVTQLLLRTYNTDKHTRSHTSRHTYARSNRPNENKMDALGETRGGIINCCLPLLLIMMGCILQNLQGMDSI